VKKRAPNKGAVRVISHSAKCSKSETTLSWSQRGPAGAQGLQGQPGEQGPQGAQGTASTNGSPDSGSAILSKLAGVDGAGSGLDADVLDGRPSADFLPARVANFAAQSDAVPLTWSYYDVDTTTGAGTEYPVGSGFVYLERTGTAGEFKVCARNNVASGYNVPYVVRVADSPAIASSLVNATGTNETCSAAFTVPDGREFTVYVQGALVVGTPRGAIQSTTPLPNRWRLIGLAFG
jgi:hypothetical protein